MDEKSTLTIISNYYLGGVFNFYRNILTNAPANSFKKKIIFLTWKGYDYTLSNEGFKLCPELFYEVGDNIRIYTKDIARLIGNEKGIVVTNFEAELSALHFYPKPEKIVIFVCHDEAYVRNAHKYEFLIDAFVAHNPFFYKLLQKDLPWRKEDIYYLPYGVEINELDKETNMNGPLNIVWLARLVESKGIFEIPLVDDLLREQNVVVNWTIIGSGPEKEKIESILKNRSNFSFASPAGNIELLELLEYQDVFVLPSRLDGLPVALLETMSRGIVPVMYKFNDGIDKIITNDLGFISEVGDNRAFAENIIKLHEDRKLLKKMSERSRLKVVNDYDIKKQAIKYFDFFKNVKHSTGKTKWKQLYAVHGREFHPYIPAILVRIFRRVRSLFKKNRINKSIVLFS